MMDRALADTDQPRVPTVLPDCEDDTTMMKAPKQRLRLKANPGFHELDRIKKEAGLVKRTCHNAAGGGNLDPTYNPTEAL